VLRRHVGELAEHIGLTRTAINNLEQGRAATPLIRLLDIAEWLDTDPQALVFGGNQCSP
jgi:DNA-binding XRE family transcriptional regulator